MGEEGIQGGGYRGLIRRGLGRPQSKEQGSADSNTALSGIKLPGFGRSTACRQT